MIPKNESNPRLKKFQKSAGVSLLLLAMFLIGSYVGTIPSFAHFINPSLKRYEIAATTAEGKDLSGFWYVWNLMREKYPFLEKEPSDTDKIYGAISGMVNSYKDPYTVFFPPQQAKLFNEQVKGSFGGVGMEVGLKNNFITVVAPLKGSPAEKAGLQAGDIIAEINDKKTDDMDIDTAISLIRGQVGTEVTLGIARKGAGELMYKKIVRETVSLPIIDTREEGDVFIISLYSFSENSAQLFTQALESFVASGKSKMIIDLRNNPGGYLDAAIDIASYFLPNGTTVVRESSGTAASEIVHTSKGYTLLNQKPQMVILINGGSASASEILAGALSEHTVATLIGTQSFGKGSVQQVIDLADGSALKITVAKWFTPNGVSISEKGIVPKNIVEHEPVLNKKTGKYSDPQLEAAIRHFTK